MWWPLIFSVRCSWVRMNVFMLSYAKQNFRWCCLFDNFPMKLKMQIIIAIIIITTKDDLYTTFEFQHKWFYQNCSLNRVSHEWKWQDSGHTPLAEHLSLRWMGMLWISLCMYLDMKQQGSRTRVWKSEMSLIWIFSHLDVRVDLLGVINKTGQYLRVIGIQMDCNQVCLTCMTWY